MGESLQNNSMFELITAVDGEYSTYYESYDQVRFYMVKNPLTDALCHKWGLPSGTGVFVTETENAAVDNQYNHYRAYGFNVETGGKAKEFSNWEELEGYFTD